MMRSSDRRWLEVVVLLGAIAIGGVMAVAQSAGTVLPLVPQPAAVQPGQGHYRLPEILTVSADTAGRRAAEVFVEQAQQTLGLAMPLADGGAVIAVQVDPAAGLGSEGYRLIIDDRGVRIIGGDPAGAFYGTQTLRQFLHHLDDSRTLPHVTITDQPRYAWRGVMLDPARHFIPVAKVKETIDLLALHKLNRLHLHLTDDQGWRIEIRRYPQLTDATRWPESARNRNDHGFYTQADIRALVDYAASRHVLLIPEIDVPAHSVVSTTVLPQLLCRTNPIHRGEKVAHHEWAEYCAGRDEPMEIFSQIIAEVAELFPGPYIHIGGDEYWGRAWAQCPDCQQRMASANLEAQDTPELRQLYAKTAGDGRRYLLYRDLMRRLAAQVVALDRTPILWDDLSWRGDYPDGAVVMQWHYKGGMDFWAKTQVPENPAAMAAAHGHDAIVAPFSHLYLDLTKPLKSIYELEPMPAELPEASVDRILGPHACNWECPLDRLDERLFPRVSVLSEVAWSPAAARSGQWAAFRGRLAAHMKVLDRLGVQYIPDPELGGTPIGQWTPGQMSEQGATLTIDLKGHITGQGEYFVLPQYQRGNHGVEIQWVALLADGVEITRDAHTGTSGWQHVNNLYRLKVAQHQPGVRYTLQIRLASKGGTNSAGHIILFPRPSAPRDR